MDESKDFEEIDLCKLNISLESVDSACAFDCSEEIKSNRDSMKESSFTEISNIDKLNISLDSIDLDLTLLEDNNIPIAKTVGPISTGISKSKNLFV